MTQEEFEKTVRARWPEAETFVYDAPTVRLGGDPHAVQIEYSGWWSATPKPYYFSHILPPSAKTLEDAVSALESACIEETEEMVSALRSVITATSPGSTVELVVRRPGDGK